MTPRKGWEAINYFYNTRVDDHNQLYYDEAWSRPGDYVLMRALTDIVQSKHVGDGRHDQRCITDRCQGDEPHAVAECIKQIGCDGGREGSLAGSTRAGEGYEPAVSIA